MERNVSEINTSDKLRGVVFRPYTKESGQPAFFLELYALAGERIAYRLRQRWRNKWTLLFQGSDFRPSPLHAIDSDETVKALMGFLTLRKGDTDAEYFEAYDAIQIQFSEQYAEALAGEVYARFGE